MTHVTGTVTVMRVSELALDPAVCGVSIGLCVVGLRRSAAPEAQVGGLDGETSSPGVP